MLEEMKIDVEKIKRGIRLSKEQRDIYDDVRQLLSDLTSKNMHPLIQAGMETALMEVMRNIVLRGEKFGG